MGGRVFIDKETGNNPVDRIPTHTLDTAAKCFLSDFKHFFSKIEFVSSIDIQRKEDHGDIDFVALPNNKNSREEFRAYLEELARKERETFISCGHEYNFGETIWKDRPVFKWVANGRMDHIAYPFYGWYGYIPLFQIDVIWANGENDFRNKVFFYSNPTAFNAVLGHFARSVGYKFSDLGLHIHVTDKRKQNFFVFLTDELEEMMKILMLPMPDIKSIFEAPEKFTEWIMSSPKFDSEMFREYHNHQSHRDSQKDPFCQEVYRQIEESNVKATIPSVKIDFTQEDLDIDEKLQVEKLILGQNIIDRVMEQIEERSKIATPVISGKDLIDMGFKPGPDFKNIIQDVSEKFGIEDELEVKKKYIEDNWRGKSAL